VVGVCAVSHYNLHSFILAHQAWGAVTRVIFRAVCLLASISALVLALRGRLPGTKIEQDSSA
jgi:hypothetical protein